jgi:3-hydroxymyristoyl/3-hydroxydecanoyl-(acyl carrier protein) dehydratase
MVTQPLIDSTARTAQGVQLELTVPPDLHYFKGHFPAYAMLPGVVQVTWAIELARQHLAFSGDFRGLSGLKFMRVIQPGSKVTLALDFDSDAQKLNFEYRSLDGSCSIGTAQFA